MIHPFYLFLLTVLCLAAAGSIAVLVIYGFFASRVEVDNAARERVVIRNPFIPAPQQLRGPVQLASLAAYHTNLRVLGQGTWYPGPLWREDTRVDLNKHPMNTGDGHTALTADGVSISVQLRFNELTGRAFNPATGELISGADAIDDGAILLAVTATDFNKRQEYVAGIVSAVIDAVIGEFRAEELFFPDEYAPIRVPKNGVPGDRGYQLDVAQAHNKPQLLEALAKYIQREVNWRLRTVGFNVDEMQVQDLPPADEKLRGELDLLQTMRARARAAGALGDIDLSGRERAALGTPGFGTVVFAETIRMLSEQLPAFARAIEAFANQSRGGGRGRRRRP